MLKRYARRRMCNAEEQEDFMQFGLMKKLEDQFYPMPILFMQFMTTHFNAKAREVSAVHTELLKAAALDETDFADHVDGLKGMLRALRILSHDYGLELHELAHVFGIDVLAVSRIFCVGGK